MFGKIVRAAIFAPVAWLIAYVVTQVGKPMLDVMASGPRGKSAKAYQYLEPVVNNILLVFLLSLLVMLLAGAVAERSAGGGI